MMMDLYQPGNILCHQWQRGILVSQEGERHYGGEGCYNVGQFKDPGAGASRILSPGKLVSLPSVQLKCYLLRALSAPPYLKQTYAVYSQLVFTDLLMFFRAPVVTMFIYLFSSDY